jgi:hypothetical protein
VIEDGVQVPTFTCPGDHDLAITNEIGVILSVISDFVSMRPSSTLSDSSVLVLPVLKVISLNLSVRQKAAVVGLFAFGCVVWLIDIARGVHLLQTGTTSEGISGFIILVSIQGNLGIVAANIPILRPLFFSRSFASHGSIRGRRSRRQEIPLTDGAEYASGHTVEVSRSSTRKVEPGAILKTVEAQVERESAVSSIKSRE